MDSPTLSRRSLLHALAAAMATAAMPVSWTEIAQAAQDVHAAGHAGTGAAATKLSFLSPAEAADVEAVASQIIPTDDSPGAREAGVVFFIDRALATFLSQLAGDYRAQLAISRRRATNGIPRPGRSRRSPPRSRSNT